MKNGYQDSAFKNKKTSSMENSGRSKAQVILGVFLFTLAIFIYFVSEIISEKDEALIKDQSSINEALVNKHLKLTDAKIQKDEKKVEIENLSALVIGQKIEVPYGSNERAAEDLIQTTQDEEVSKLIRPNETDYQLNSPRQHIYNKLQEQNLQSEYYEYYKEAYINAFIEKAREQGYEIKVNENLVVTSIRKIESAKGPSLDPKRNRIRY